jgi:hypothetical protein
MRVGRFESARALLDQVVRVLEHAGLTGSFEHLYGRSQCLLLSAVAQDYDALERDVVAMRLAMRDRPDTALRATLENLDMWLTAFRGDLEASRTKAAALRALFPEERPTIQRLMADFLGLLPELYLTDCRTLRADVRAGFKRGIRFRPFGQWLTSTLTGLAALVEANALRAGEPTASQRLVHRYAAIADRTTITFPGASWRARAYAADARGRTDRAIEHLERAERISHSYGQRADTAIAKYQRGIRIGGDEGHACVETAREMIRAAGSHERLLLEDVGSR